MLKDSVVNAEKISERIIKDNKEATISDELIKEVAAGKPVTTNDAALVRRVVSFTGTQPILQMKVPGKRARVFQPMTEEELAEYDLTDKNFSRLSTDDIIKIRKRIKEIEPEIKPREILRYLTICDMLVQIGAKRGYVKCRRRYTAFSVNISTDELDDYLKFLENAGILSIAPDKSVRYNEIFNDIDFEPEVEEYKPKNAQKKWNYDDYRSSMKSLKSVSAFINDTADYFASLEEEIKGVRDENKKLRKRYEKANAMADNVPVIMSSYQELKNSTDEIVEKRIKEYRELASDRLDTVFADATKKLARIIDGAGNSLDPKTELQLHSLFSDLSKSAKLAVRARRGSKNKDDTSDT